MSFSTLPEGVDVDGAPKFPDVPEPSPPVMLVVPVPLFGSGFDTPNPLLVLASTGFAVGLSLPSTAPAGTVTLSRSTTSHVDHVSVPIVSVAFTNFVPASHAPAGSGFLH